MLKLRSFAMLSCVSSSIKNHQTFFWMVCGSFLIFMVVSFLSILTRRSLTKMAEPGVFSVAYVTVPNEECAKKMASGVVTEQLAACVNIIPNIISVYKWEGKVSEDPEYLLMLKTRTSKIDALTNYVKENHPYKVCEVISMPIQNGNPDYFNWMSEVLPA